MGTGNGDVTQRQRNQFVRRISLDGSDSLSLEEVVEIVQRLKQDSLFLFIQLSDDVVDHFAVEFLVLQNRFASFLRELDLHDSAVLGNAEPIDIFLIHQLVDCGRQGAHTDFQACSDLSHGLRLSCSDGG